MNSPLELIQAYYVRSHDGRRITDEDPSAFIQAWLAPDTTAEVLSDPLTAIQQGARFEANRAMNQEIIDLIFDNRIPVASVMIDDFANWPMRRAWQYDPWELLQGYIRAINPLDYFEGVTGERASNFMNHTERIFYLTRGYGRPNKYISSSDLNLRRLYMSAVPTALIALTDILLICPTRQNPDFILEGLSEIDLSIIDKFHQTSVIRITQCLNGARLCAARDALSPRETYNSPGSFDDRCLTGTCATGLESCNPALISCFENFLRSIGALPIFEYDPSTNIFISNISQLDQYRQVIPDKRWSLEEVMNMPDVYVAGILRRLPDLELLNIETPLSGSLRDNLTLNNLSDRLRETLLDEATRFLTEKRYFLLPSGVIGYGRPVDESLQEMTSQELIESLLDKGALIDPYENPINPDTAEMLFGSESTQVQPIIYKTRAMAIENGGYITSLTREQRENLVRGFRGLLENEIEVEVLQALLEESGPYAMKLLLWSGGPVGLDFEDYFRSWSPLYQKILKDTLNYYVQILPL